MPAPAVFTIPPHRSFADALAAGLLARFGGDPMELARGIVLLPNNRAVRTVRDAFVRHSGGGLLLPRLVPIGDADLGDQIGVALDPLGAEPIPPAIEPVERQFRLARLVQRHRDVDAAEALRLAGELGRTLDQLIVEQVEPHRLRAVAADHPDLARHWQVSLDVLELILSTWPAELATLGRIDLADRRNRLLAATERRWREAPQQGFVCAAGITTAAPAVARLLRRVARMERGLVVLPGLDLDMPEEEWDMLGPPEPEPGTRPLETHPQLHLKLLLHRLDTARGEVERWRWGGGLGAAAVRGRAVANALAPPDATHKWHDLPAPERRLSGIRALEVADPAEEAQAIALVMREALETPERTAALVTPDRDLARRVSAHLKRWGIEADDSAGRPLSQLPPGTLLVGLAAAASERFAPVALLGLLAHPLVRAGDARLGWLDGVRALDLALRGPRPPAGLSGVSAFLEDGDRRKRAAADFWEREAMPLLLPLEKAASALGDAPDALFTGTAPAGLADFLACLRTTAEALAGEEVWRGPAGRAASDAFAAIEAAAEVGPERLDLAAVPTLLEAQLAAVAVRPPYGQHPRLFIWGLLEARLQQADLMILGALNEGVWPAASAPDPWLAPRIRADLGLPSLDRRIGLSAHDFAMALGGEQAIVTRARRAARSPSVASRFWLRLEAMTGGITLAEAPREWLAALDRPVTSRAASRPAPRPPLAARPRELFVTDLDRLKADPYAFYARQMLKLRPIDAVDADPTAAWRGIVVHEVFEKWMEEDGCDPAKLRPRAEKMLADQTIHPMMRALWAPRLMEAIDHVAGEMEAGLAEGRKPVAAESDGKAAIGPIILRGRVDRIDRDDAGRLAIVDYKTGQAPSKAAVDAGFALQLGLLGLIAQAGGFKDIGGAPEQFEYWSLAKDRGSFGRVIDAAKRSGMDAEAFLAAARKNLLDAVDLWLTGDEAFTAKLNPAFSPYGDYDQLMRLEEWYGRD